MGDAGSASAPRRRMGSIRVRTVAAAVLVVGVSLAAAAVATVTFVERSLRTQARDAALIRAEAVANQLDAGAAPETFGAGDPDADDEFLQVLDRNGDVLVSSANISGRAAAVMLDPGEEVNLSARSSEMEPFDEPFVVVAVAATRSGEPLTVIVGGTLETVMEAAAATRGSLVIAVPLLLLVVGSMTWVVVGRALAPVEAIRSEVDAISTKELDRRVPDPGGQDEIARLAGTMNRMLGRLEQGNLRQRRFVSDASHELRSPLSSIRQHAEVAASYPDRVVVRELADVVLEEEQRLERLVDDLLLLSRMDEGMVIARSEPVDLRDVVLAEGARLRGSTDLRIATDDVSRVTVGGDRTQLERLVRNLVDNAARHARGTVAMSLSDGGNGVTLRVDDDGRGVAESDRERVFDRFVRLDDARDRDSGGSGLGLPIVREIATRHGATVRVAPSDLGGARFEVTFPHTP